MKQKEEMNRHLNDVHSPPKHSRKPSSNTTNIESSDARREVPHSGVPGVNQGGPLPNVTSDIGSAVVNPSDKSDVDKLVQLVASLVKDRTSPHDASCGGRFAGPDWTASRQLAWAQIKSDTRALRFDGKDPAIYRKWKAGLEDEVGVLKLSSRMWLTLLGLRTTGLAAEMITRSDHMAAESPDAALALVWEEFDERFSSQPKAAKDLMKKLVEFPPIQADNKDQLWSFALVCKQAGSLMGTDQGHELKMLDYPEAQLNVTERLPPKLFEKWKHYAYKYHTVAS